MNTLYENKDGESKTLSEWAKTTGINLSTLICRIKSGMSIDDAVNNSTDKKHAAFTDPTTGETHSVKEWSEILNIPYSTLCKRISSGWPAEKVLHGEKNKTGAPVTNYSKYKRDHIDLTGEMFGYLEVIKRSDHDYVYTANGKIRYEWRWDCKCHACGREDLVSVIQHNLTNKHTTNCGCMNKNSIIDMTGKQCGYLKVLERAESKAGDGSAMWLCECVCGNKVIVSGRDLRARRNTISCGCKTSSVNGLSGTRLYVIYQDMIRRCYNPSAPEYKWYGGRGIYVCDEWVNKDDGGFIRFYDWGMSHGYNDSLTIERMDNDGPYAPWNCVWTDQVTQANNRRNNHVIEYNNISHTLSEWSVITGIKAPTILKRLNNGMTPEEALTTPVEPRSPITRISYGGENYTCAVWDKIRGFRKGATFYNVVLNGTPANEFLDPNTTTRPINAIYFIDESGKPIPQDQVE